MKRKLLLAVFLVLSILALWVLYAPWPDPVARPLSWRPEVILVLGGGDEARAREAIRLAETFPEVPVIVSGDGGHMEKLLRASEVTKERLVIEPDATSTWENAILSAPILDQLHATRVVVVTNWFHETRARAVFEKAIPWIDVEMSFEPAPQPLPPWDKGCHRREKLAAMWYAVRYGVWAFPR
jgi:uncharacterized SAM-binding protein YcdF (DUF218 family)